MVCARECTDAMSRVSPEAACQRRLLKRSTAEGCTPRRTWPFEKRETRRTRKWTLSQSRVRNPKFAFFCCGLVRPLGHQADPNLNNVATILSEPERGADAVGRYASLDYIPFVPAVKATESDFKRILFQLPFSSKIRACWFCRFCLTGCGPAQGNDRVELLTDWSLPHTCPNARCFTW